MNTAVADLWEKLEAMLHGVIISLPNLGVACLVVMLCYGAGKGGKALVIRVTEQRQRHRNLGVVLGRLAQWGIGFVGLLVAFSILLPSFRAGDLIQLLGIGSVAIGFAFRDIFQNFLAGILLLLTEPFRVGDQIVVNAFEGTVEDIRTRASVKAGRWGRGRHRRSAVSPLSSAGWPRLTSGEPPRCLCPTGTKRMANEHENSQLVGGPALDILGLAGLDDPGSGGHVVCPDCHR
jgi:hypothetical protein